MGFAFFGGIGSEVGLTTTPIADAPYLTINASQTQFNGWIYFDLSAKWSQFGKVDPKEVSVL